MEKKKKRCKLLPISDRQVEVKCEDKGGVSKALELKVCPTPGRYRFEKPSRFLNADIVKLKKEKKS